MGLRVGCSCGEGVTQYWEPYQEHAVTDLDHVQIVTRLSSYFRPVVFKLSSTATANNSTEAVKLLR